MPDVAAMDPAPKPDVPAGAPPFGSHFDPFSGPAEATAPPAGSHFDPFSGPAEATAPPAGSHFDPFSGPAEATAPVSAAVRSASVAPPGWKPTQPPVIAAPAGAGAAALALPAFGALTRSTPADAAIRWRLRAARIDNLIVYGGYVLLCLALHWSVFSLSSLLVGFGLSVLYHFVFEANGGQTPGKRRVGVQVVSVDGGPADPKAIAIRSVLRLIDQLPVWYASGLVSMIRTGPQRRQRIGDVAARTMVVAVDGRAAERGTPSWGLPLATVLAVVLSAVFVYQVSSAGTEPLTAQQQTEFIASCEANTPAGTDCTCILTQLEAGGYDSLNSMNGLLAQGRAAVIDNRPSEVPRAITSAVRACTTG